MISGTLEIDPDPQLEREADEAAKEALSGEEPLIVNRMGTDVHIQRATSEVSVENNYAGIRDLKEEVADLREAVAETQQDVDETKSDLGALEDEVHSGLGEKAMGVAGAGMTAGTIALGRAGTEPMLKEMLSDAAVSADLASPAIAAAMMAIGVGAAGKGIKELYDRAKERFFGDDTDEDEQFEEETRDEDTGWFNRFRN